MPLDGLRMSTLPYKASVSVLDRRRAGVLLHLTSLPSTGRYGYLGQDAYRFVDFLANCAITVWQMLPICPTHRDGSPYQCLSVHAGNPVFIDLEQLAKEGLLPKKLIAQLSSNVRNHIHECLAKAQRKFFKICSSEDQHAYQEFLEASSHWLDDYACYCVLRKKYANKHWLKWPARYRDCDAGAIQQLKEEFAAQIDQIRFEQFIFFRQWRHLKQYANKKGIHIFGDIPFFVSHDSADVWSNKNQFYLDNEGKAKAVAGVPPDYFSATGQLWGNPQYDWEQMQSDGFQWWIKRIKTQLTLFDLVRLDHFRAFESYWEIPADAQTAIDGRWLKTPGDQLFQKISAKFGSLPFVAEDLGLITPEVTAMRNRLEFPGMKILQFAFDSGPDNPYLLHNHETNSVAYTGTHDNDTTLGWFNQLAGEQQQRVLDYLPLPHEPMPWPLIRLAFSSVALLAVVPLQDILMLGCEHRMNTPGTSKGNWRWRFHWQQFDASIIDRLRQCVETYGRI